MNPFLSSSISSKIYLRLRGLVFTIYRNFSRMSCSHLLTAVLMVCTVLRASLVDADPRIAGFCESEAARVPTLRMRDLPVYSRLSNYLRNWYQVRPSFESTVRDWNNWRTSDGLNLFDVIDCTAAMKTDSDICFFVFPFSYVRKKLYALAASPNEHCKMFFSSTSS